jgi:hypothetical protein
MKIGLLGCQWRLGFECGNDDWTLDVTGCGLAHNLTLGNLNMIDIRYMNDDECSKMHE